MELDRYSWSSILSFLTCQRRFELERLEGLEAIPNEERLGLLFGTAVHAGIHTYLLTPNLKTARDHAHKALDQATPHNVTVYNPGTKTRQINHAFYNSIQSLHVKIDEVLNYYLPRLGIGTKYRVARYNDVFPSGTKLYTAAGKKPLPMDVMLEWKFEFPIPQGLLTGIIDAVLVDLQTGELIVCDWKTRASFESDIYAQLDGQLHLYASVLNRLGATIKQVAMVEMRTKTPSPVELGKGKGTANLPLTGRASYDTTEDYWVKSLPAGIDPSKYLPDMQGKFKQESDFLRWTIMPVTPESDESSFRNTMSAVEAMAEARQKYKRGEALPAALGSHACKFCAFARLCVSPLRYGGDVSELIDTFYTRKTLDSTL